MPVIPCQVAEKFFSGRHPKELKQTSEFPAISLWEAQMTVFQCAMEMFVPQRAAEKARFDRENKSPPRKCDDRLRK
jgi:hypothetical protein